MDSGDRRLRILRAAADLFTTHGYAGVSMDDVLAAVGGSKSTLYRYFADKTDLFRAAVEMLIDERSQPVRTFRADPTTDVAGTLVELGRHFAAVVLEPGAIALHRLVTSEAVRVEGLGRTFYEHGPAVGDAVLGDYIRRQCEVGVLTVADPLLAGSQLYQAMIGALQMRMLVNASDQPTPAEVEASVSAAVDAFLHGTLSRPATVGAPSQAAAART